MKKRLTTFMLMLTAILFGSSAWAQTFTQDGLKYTVTDETAKTVSVSRESNILAGDVVIPSTVSNGGTAYTVTAIENNAFYNTAITSITVPASVQTIGTRAFESCSSLVSVTLLDSETEISVASGWYGSFYGADAGKNVYVGRNVTPTENSCPFSNTTSVTFGDKVTEIHRNLFQNQYKLSSVTIGNGVKTIGQYAFSGSGTDETVGEMVVSMGSSVTTIVGSAFEGCSKLRSIALPSTLKVIEGYAFSGAGLTAVTIPASVDSIGNRVFANNANLASINIEDADKELKLYNGYYGAFYGSDADKSVYIGRNLWRPENTTVFGGNVTSVAFGDNVTTINPNLFYDANKLSSVVIGKGVTEIGDHAFYSAGDTEDVGEMTITLGENVRNIRGSAFEGCSKLRSLTLPEKLDTIFGYAFQSSGLTAITIPASVDSIADRAFAYCGSLASIRIQDSAKELKLYNGYYGAFNGSDADKTVYVGRDLWRPENTTVFGANVTSVEFSDQVTVINPNLFYGVDKLSSVTIGSGVTEIGDHAFYDAGDAEDVGEMMVTLGENVRTIGGSAFEGCDKLMSLTLPEKLDTIFGYAFQSSGLTAVTIPASVDSIGDRAFGYCESLASIRIQDSANPLIIRNGYYGTFAYSDAEKTVYVGRDLIRNSNGERVISNPTSVEIGDQVTAINPYMFYDSNKLASLKIGNGVETIGAYAFKSSGDDETVGELSITMGSSVTSIGEEAFNSCTTMKTVALPSSLKTIDQYAFSSSGLTAVTIPASVDSLGLGVFGYNANQASITFEDGDQPLKLHNGFYGTFRNPTVDYTLYLGRNLVYTDDTNASPFPYVATLEIGPQVTNLPQRMFYNCDKLTTVTGGENVETMGAGVYNECNNLASISPLGKNLKVLPESTFELCENLDGIVLPEGLEEIQQWAFHRCRALTELTIPGSVKVMGTKPDGGNGYRVFYENNAMKKLTIADSDEPLLFADNYGVFFRFPALEQLYMGRNITTEASNNAPFSSADQIVFGPAVTEIGTQLKDCTPTSVKAPWLTPITITDAAFNNNTYSNATLWLPGGTRQAYTEATGWKNFVNMDFASFIVSVEASQGGSLTVGDITVANGEKAQTLVDRESNVTFKGQPAGNYDFTALTINGEEVELADNSYTYANLLTDIDVKATFTEKPKFDIKATATGGTVSLNGAAPDASQTIKVYRDTDVTLAIAAAEGYEKPKVTVNGTDVTSQLKDNQLTIENIQEAKTIVVTFAKKKFSVTTQTTQNGTIELSKTTVEWGDSFTATFKPATGYELATATLNGEDVTAQVKAGVLTVTDVKEAKTVGATFKKQTFQIAKEQTQNGTIELSKTTVEWGDGFTATFKPATGYELATATVNGQDMTASVKNNVLTVNNVQEDKTVGATFQKQTYTVSISGGGVTVSNPNPKYGDNVTVTIEDDPDRTLVSLVVNGVDVTAQVKDGKYTITNVTGNVTIEATFKSTKEFITLTDDTYATFSCPQDLNFTGSDLRAYVATGFNKATGQALLTRVYDVPAGTGVFLVGEPGKTYKIAYSETTSYYVNLFRANLTKSTIEAADGDKVNYIYDVKDGDPGFYPVEGTATLLAQTAYMQLPAGFVSAGVKVSVVFEEDIIDGIDEFRMDGIDETIYDIAGRRLGKKQHGINIVNGKKVLVK